MVVVVLWCICCPFPFLEDLLRPNNVADLATLFWMIHDKITLFASVCLREYVLTAVVGFKEVIDAWCNDFAQYLIKYI